MSSEHVSPVRGPSAVNLSAAHPATPSEAYYDALWADTRRVDQHHKCRIHALAKMLRVLPAAPAGTRRILELGCGSGIVSAFLAQYGQVTGIDQSTVGIESARAHIPGHFIVGTLPPIPVADHDFDLCVLSQVIEHFEDADQAVLLEGARERVRPGGHILLTTPNRPVSSRMRFRPGELQPTENWHDPAELEQLLMRTGWRVVEQCFAFNFLPVLVSKHVSLRGLRYLIYDVLRLRNVVEDLLDGLAVGDSTVVLAVKA